MKTQDKIYVGIYSYSERELSQIIRRKMISKSCKNKKKYNRKRVKKDSSSFEFFVKRSIFKMNINYLK